MPQPSHKPCNDVEGDNYQQHLLLLTYLESFLTDQRRTARWWIQIAVVAKTLSMLDLHDAYNEQLHIWIRHYFFLHLTREAMQLNEAQIVFHLEAGSYRIRGHRHRGGDQRLKADLKMLWWLCSSATISTELVCQEQTRTLRCLGRLLDKKVYE